MPRTHADKRKAVETLLADEEWSQWSDRQIAEAALVSHQLVAVVRDKVVAATTCNNRQPKAVKGKDGKTYRRKRKKTPPKKPQQPAVDVVDDEPEPELDRIAWNMQQIREHLSRYRKRFGDDAEYLCFRMAWDQFFSTEIE